jgi:endonuclease/exonuclease/phosphatase family metal-dependent hydrolase
VTGSQLRTSGSPSARPAPTLLRWLARAAVVPAALFVGGMSLALTLPLPPAWWLELLHYVPFPVFLLPALFAFCASWLLRPAWRLLAGISVLLVLSVVMGAVWGHADHGEAPLRVMTYNVKAYLAEERRGGFVPLVREVSAHQPDLLVMQDAGALAEWRRESPDSVAPIFAGRQVYAHGQFIVVSRYPLHDCRNVDLTVPGRFNEYLRCRVSAPGGDFDLFTAHLLSPREGLNATRRERLQGLDEWRENFTERLAQATRLAGDATPRPRPLIVAGDLNAPERAAVLRVLLHTGLRDAFSAAGRGWGYTHGHSLKLRLSFLRIDHILVSPEFGVVDSFVGGKEASEHRPVIADLLLRRGSP